MIEILRALSCMSYQDFLEIMDKQDDYYTKDKFSEMKGNLAAFLMELDSSTAANFIEFASHKAGVGL